MYQLWILPKLNQILFTPSESISYIAVNNVHSIDVLFIDVNFQRQWIADLYIFRNIITWINFHMASRHRNFVRCDFMCAKWSAMFTSICGISHLVINANCFVWAHNLCRIFRCSSRFTALIPASYMITASQICHQFQMRLQYDRIEEFNTIILLLRALHKSREKKRRNEDND